MPRLSPSIYLPHMLAFNALSIFMWNCSADLWSLQSSPSPQVCMWLTQLCAHYEQWKDRAVPIFSSLQRRLSSTLKWWMVKTSKLRSDSGPENATLRLSVFLMCCRFYLAAVEKHKDANLSPSVRGVNTQKNELRDRETVGCLVFTKGVSCLNFIACTCRLVCWLSNSPAYHGNHS